MTRFVHVEITAQDMDRATAFYAAALGLTGADAGVPGMTYYLIAAGRPDATGIGGAIMPRQYQSQPTIATVSVTDIDATLAKVKAAGGRQLGIVNVIPTVGRHVYIEDTEHNVLGLLQPEPDMA